MILKKKFDIKEMDFHQKSNFINPEIRKILTLIALVLIIFDFNYKIKNITY